MFMLSVILVLVDSDSSCVSLAGCCNKDITFSIFDRILLEKIIAFFRSGNFEAVRRACPGQLRKLLRSRTKTHC